MKTVADMTLDEVLAESRRRDARRAQGLPLTETPTELAERIAEDDDRLEKEIQREAFKELRAHGFTVYWFSQKRRTGQTKGPGDLYAVHEERGLVVWYECKTPTGEQSPAQKDFEHAHRYTHETVTVVVGGIEAVRHYLAKIGGMRE